MGDMGDSIVIIEIVQALRRGAITAGEAAEKLVIEYGGTAEALKMLLELGENGVWAARVIWPNLAPGEETQKDESSVLGGAINGVGWGTFICGGVGFLVGGPAGLVVGVAIGGAVGGGAGAAHGCVSRLSERDAARKAADKAAANQ
ncbi:hypothetical protein TSOC_008428 [Tetrabaena socialis]|uniref:Uncharacterized protein n=1 Tax=Tetrabaena socialis TaxID=47790 RepID=A0A2J7ZYF1_9CHLO|nr:hypothetical protein TSOC_008428 [Tetrabaena socialis]|eukprot:PNH05303.1 hypothetical protein TSOC_008428 [Tetrabaena socialis]